MEGCSREDRDEWAADITAVVKELQAAGDAKATREKDADESKLHNIELT